MAYTKHGHHIPGSISLGAEDRPSQVARCGGVRLCKSCQSDTTEYLIEQDAKKEEAPNSLHHRGEFSSELNSNTPGLWEQHQVELIVHLPCSCGEESIVKSYIPEKDIIVSKNPHPALHILMGAASNLHEIHVLVNSQV
ncbi:hypothetical protein HWC66_gp82 [Gordonia phage Chikenjars]|uniref:Uncharacterized protein n=1 Tax=Gordonia phage Chikenjars TaxID=2601686 RepID=A0A5J6DA92_9CAUD|nr:hypothetical protein HWC66_gp82 [Gordonia phage Chikenjars]QEQ94385.1 hypothetical protein SEA_CHIKENJARS_82 [Gordonia phage Chikenjars]